MKYRRLGRTGFEVSEVGFGAWGLGGNMWLGVPEEEGDRALETALDLGVNFIDTALVYGEGWSEQRIGKVLGKRPERERIRVATKIPPRNFEWPGRAEAKLREVFSAVHVAASVEASLRNLRVEVLDIEQFHVWNDAWLDDPEWPEVRSTMERLKNDGKVRHWGVSINDHAPETAMRLLRDPLIDTVQAIYNIFDRSPERGLFDVVRQRDLGVIVRVPFDEGALTGKVRPETVFPEGDWRNGYFRGDRKAEVARRADALVALLGPEAATLPELALRFVLSRSEVGSVIPGMRTVEHARANAAVSDGRVLSAALLDRLREHAWEKNW